MVAGTTESPGTPGTCCTTSATRARRTNTSWSDAERLSGSKPERIGQTGLRIEVHHEETPPLLRQGDTERLHGGRLGDAALLVGDGDDFDHRRSLRLRPARVLGAEPAP